MQKATIILIFIITLSLNGQNNNLLGWNFSEIFIITRGLTFSQTIRYKMESKSIVWTKPDSNPPSNYSITDTLNQAYYPPLWQSETWNTIENTSIFGVGGFNFIGGDNQVDPYAMDSYGYGIYKVSIFDETAYFYIDYRDNRYRNYNYFDGHPQDIWIKYNVLQNQFFYRNSSPDMKNLDSTDWVGINKGDYLAIWNLKNQVPLNSPQTGLFPDFWKNSLVAIPSEGSGSNLFYVPHLVWGPKPNYSA